MRRLYLEHALARLWKRVKISSLGRFQGVAPSGTPNSEGPVHTDGATCVSSLFTAPQFVGSLLPEMEGECLPSVEAASAETNLLTCMTGG